jgi:drug/metabolite transporter (DMT)-like permease
MSLWLAIGAGITLCGTALFELVRTRGRSAVLAVAMLAGAAVAFSVAGLATKHEHKPAAPVTNTYFDHPPDPYFGNP